MGKSATEKSEEEIGFFLKQHFGEEDIELHPQVENKKADFRVKSIDTYIEVHAIKDIAEDQMDVFPSKKLPSGLIITPWKLKDDGRKKILDRIANKLLHESGQLP